MSRLTEQYSLASWKTWLKHTNTSLYYISFINWKLMGVQGIKQYIFKTINVIQTHTIFFNIAAWFTSVNGQKRLALNWLKFFVYNLAEVGMDKSTDKFTWSLTSWKRFWRRDIEIRVKKQQFRVVYSIISVQNFVLSTK